MLVVKLIFVALLMALTSYITWQLDTKQAEEFKLKQANEAVALQKQRRMSLLSQKKLILLCLLMVVMRLQKKKKQ